MALPSSFTGYSTIQNNYNRLAGVQPTSALQGPTGYDPIQYSQPVNTLRQQRDVININTDGGNSQSRVDSRANRMAEDAMGNLQAQGRFMSLIEPNRIAGLDQYQLTPREQANYRTLNNAGYSQGYSLANAGSGVGSGVRYNSPEGQFIQDIYNRNTRDQAANNALIGYNPSSALEQSYQRLFNRLG